MACQLCRNLLRIWQAISNLKVRIRASFVAYILLLLTIAGARNCFALLYALIIHEAGHACVAKILKEPIAIVELLPFGGVMRYKDGCAASKGIRGVVLALAGPAMNYATVFLISTIKLPINRELCSSLINVNLSMMLLNLLPALPFDGGAAIFSIGYYLFNVSLFIRILSIMGQLTGIVFCILSLFGLAMYGKINLTLIVIGIYVFCYAVCSKEALFAQNIYSIVCEQCEQNRTLLKAACFLVNENEKICSLIPYLNKMRGTVFLIERDEGNLALIGEKQVCRALLDSPYMLVKDIKEK